MGKLAKIGLSVCLLFLVGFRAFLPADGSRLSSADQPWVTSQAPPSKAATIVTAFNVATEEQDQLDILPDWLPCGAAPFVFNRLPVVVALSAVSGRPVGERAGPFVAYYLLFCSLRIPLR